MNLSTELQGEKLLINGIDVGTGRGRGATVKVLKRLSLSGCPGIGKNSQEREIYDRQNDKYV